MDDEITEDTFIHPTAIIEDQGDIGWGTKVWHNCHVRQGAYIGCGCSLGRNVYVDAGATIKHRCRIQNNVSIYNGVILEEYVFVGPSVVFTNDKYPRAWNGGDWIREATIVGTRASIGAGAVIVCGITIGEYAMVGAGAVVSRDVEPYELVIGDSLHAGFVGKDGRRYGDRRPLE